MGTLTYDTNNSGGGWWLTDDNWRALEAAGWTVHWLKDEPHYRDTLSDGRWLGALAKKASLETDNPDASILEWERIAGQNAGDEGCNCCGPPHNFSFTVDGKTRYLDVEYGEVSREWS